MLCVSAITDHFAVASRDRGCSSTARSSCTLQRRHAGRRCAVEGTAGIAVSYQPSAKNKNERQSQKPPPPGLADLSPKGKREENQKNRPRQTSLPGPLSCQERGRKAKKTRHVLPISGARASLPSYFEQPTSFNIKVLFASLPSETRCEISAPGTSRISRRGQDALAPG